MPSKDKVGELALLPLVKELQSHLRATYNSLRDRCDHDGTKLFVSLGHIMKFVESRTVPVALCIHQEPSEVLCDQSFINPARSSLRPQGRMCNSCLPLWS